MAEPFVQDMFISYAEADGKWVEGYLMPTLSVSTDRVRTHRDFAPGQPLVDEYTRAVELSHYTLLVLSPAFVADRWASLAKDLSSYLNAEGKQGRLIPLRLHPTDLGLELRSLVALDFTDPDDWDDASAQLRRLLGQPLPVQEAVPCPYPGLRAFNEHDHECFFGREDQTKELVARLRMHPFLAVIGPSGSGKSSLVFAGLVPAVRRSGLFGSEPWTALSVRPGAAPMEAETIVIGTDPPEPGPRFADLLITPPRKLLLVVDQFEELYSTARDRTPEQEGPFQEALDTLAHTPGCHVVLTVRADFYPELMASPLWPEIEAHRLEVLPLAQDGLRRAIAQPAERVGVYVEATLVERLVADAAGEPGMLPLVQETLVYLWEELRAHFLGVKAYEDLGRLASKDAGECTGLQVAMARHADAALAELSPKQQIIAWRIFFRLVQFGEGRTDTRRQQSIAELQSITDPPRAFEETLNHLVEARLLTLGALSPTASQGRNGAQVILVDLAHEALIEGWPQLEQWLRLRREVEQARRRLEEKAAEWARLGRGSGGLLDEVELLDMHRWFSSLDAADLGTSPELSQLVAASVDSEATRERSRYLGQAAGGGVGAGLGYGIAFGLAYWSQFSNLGMNTVLLLALSIFPVGALVGFCIGLGLWLGRENWTRRVLATGLIGTVVGCAVYVMYQRFTIAPNDPIVVSYLVSGSLLGAGLGLSVGLTETKYRLIGTTFGGLIGVGLASLVGDLSSWDLLTAILAGLFLGGLTGLGFRATAAKPSLYLNVPAPA